ncbi:MAG: effector-associated domain EAD1-containing protein [Xenococcus sp. MO_188.B8]|nr:effector-associated domain EAD1-containing protein [Xenococcus sp. MO_188.B8]
MSSANVPGYLIHNIELALRRAFPDKTELKMMLRHQFNQNLPALADGKNLKEITFNLVDYFRKKNQLEQLINKACQENKDNPELQEVARKLPITTSLFQILQALEKKYIQEMQRAYKVCCSENSWDDYEDNTPDSLNEIFKRINDIPQKENHEEPIVQFVVVLLENENILNLQGKKLKEWGHKYGNNFDKILAKNCKLLENKEPISEIQPYLLVKLKLSQQSPKQPQNQYIVSSWLITDTSNYDYLKSNENCKYLKNILNKKESEKSIFTLEEVPKLLESFLSQRIQYLKKYHAKPIVILFLPHKLLNDEIEKIPIQDDDDLAIPIGSEYCVVFRSVKRLDKQYSHGDNWLRKWKRIEDNAEVISSTHFTCSNCEKWEELFSDLEEDNAVAVKLNKIPCDDIFKIIDRTAVPITLWLRKNDFESSEMKTIQDDFDKLLKCKINELPHQVKQLRLKAFSKTDKVISGKEHNIGVGAHRNAPVINLIKKTLYKFFKKSPKQEHIGNYLALLWEDPNLRPPEINYTSPN